MLLAAMAASASAAPAADVVVVWAPGASIQPIEAVAQRHGAAVIDRSPAPPAVVETAQFLQRGIDAYQALKLDAAQAALDQARVLAEKTGAAGLTKTQLSDLFLYRGLVKIAAGDETAAWDELVTAITIFPTRTLDPEQYAPKVKELLARVEDDVLHKHPQAQLSLDAPPGCTAFVDGEAVAGPMLRITGPHWIRVACPDHAPWSTRVDLTTLDSHIVASPKPYEPPAEAELLVQARASGARAILVIEIRGPIASVGLLGIDGRERERRTFTVDQNLGALAAGVDEMLSPPVVATRAWYKSRWAWAAAAAIVTAAIVIPITAALASDNGATTWTATVKGLPF